MTNNRSDLLPILNHKSAIQEALQEHQTLVIAGDTGSGKTTQIPQFCLDLASDQKPALMIGCTQPRRVAAVSVAERVTEELDQAGKDGQVVGCKIRFHDHTGPETRIKFMTDGVLLAETRNDPLLRRYGVIIIDEAHERSLNIDFLLGFLKNLLPRRPDLKLIITSATIDTAIFSRHFDQAPVITIEGRNYPVEVRYSPIEDDPLNEKDDYVEHSVRSTMELHQISGARDTLIFLPTERDILTCCALLEQKMPDCVILPIFGRLQGADQRRIFQNFKQCKIVVATNVAETSITVPGIRYVVDSGLARISQYNVRARTISLPVSKISRASCDQRKGRCGRIGPGICVRLFAEEDYQGREPFTAPEIKRANLAEVILQMIAYNLGSPHNFPFIEPPHNNAIRDGYRLLTELGAIDHRGKLTTQGRIMATLPIDPCIARIILAARDNNCLREIKIIAAALAIPDPRIRPADRAQEADTAHRRFAHPDSDFLALLHIWDLFHDVRDQVKSWNRLKKFCVGNFLSFQRMREWLDLHEQLERILSQRDGFADNSSPASYAAIHQALCTGFLRNIATKQKERNYLGGGGIELAIFPGSNLFSREAGDRDQKSRKNQNHDSGGAAPTRRLSENGSASHQWIMAASFMETNRLYAMTVAAIDQEWLEVLGGPLCKRSWSHPRWQKKSGQVVADEKVTLFGLVIVAGRKVNYGRLDAEKQAEARHIFIQSALVAGELEGSFPFLTHNLELLDDWQATEERLRKRDLLVDERALEAFYEQRIPADVYDRFTLVRFLRRKKEDEKLRMSETDILRRQPEERELSDFPPQLTVGSHQFRLEYHFAPGAEDDGVTVRIPLDLIDTLQEPMFEWLVPGLLREKITFLLKGLPKSIRKFLIPLNNTVDLLLDDLDLYKGSLLMALERSILKAFSRNVARQDWPTELPPHLTMRFLLLDRTGIEVSAGRSLALLRENRDQSNAPVTTTALRQQDQQSRVRWEGRIFATWDFDGLPASLPLFTTQQELCGSLFPALTPLKDRGGVAVEFVTSQKEAAHQNREGLNFLYQLEVAEPFKALKKYCATCLSAPSAAWLIRGMGERSTVTTTLLSCILTSIFNTASGTIPTREEFQQALKRAKQEDFYGTGRRLCDTIMALLRQQQEVAAHIQHFGDLARKNRSFSKERYDEYARLLEEILPLDFLTSREAETLQLCGTEMKALMIRIERAYADPAKDTAKASQLQPHLHNLESLYARENDLTPECLLELLKYREMISQFRIALFAPEIQSAYRVSSKKLDQQWQKTRSSC